MLIEIRSTGAQTVFPGSTHEKTGERIEWVNPSVPVARISPQELKAKVNQIRAFGFLASVWPKPGAMFAAALALVGVLLRYTDFSVELIANLVTTLCGDNSWKKHIQLARSGDRRLEQDRKVQGIPSLQAAIGKEATAKFCVLMGIEDYKPTYDDILEALQEVTPHNAESKAQEIVELAASARLSKIEEENILKRLNKASQVGMGALRAAYKEANGYASEVQSETLAQRLLIIAQRGELWHDDENNHPFVSVQLEDHNAH